MGISANQARLMTLTARQHDLELRAQQISAEKMIKGLESQEAATDYSKLLNIYSTLKQIKALPMKADWDTIIASGYSPEYFYEASYENGVLSYRDIRADENLDDIYCWSNKGQFLLDEIGWSYLDDFPLDSIAKRQIESSVGRFGDDNGVEVFLQATQGQYERFTTSLSAEEKLLDMELTQINTEHSAVKTEYDSIKGLVGENVDKSFNVFG